MTKEQINGYSVRISQSTKTELVVITYEIILDYIKDAEDALSQNNKKDFVFFTKKAMSFLDDLCSSLDMKYPISADLLSLYIYVKKILIHANAAYTDEGLDIAVKIITGMKNAFESVAKQEVKPERVIQNGEQIYAGFTYGKDSRLNEYVFRNE